MDYARLVRDAFYLTWRHRFLWVFGLFAGGGTCSPNFNLPSGGGPSGGGAPAPVPPAQRLPANPFDATSPDTQRVLSGIGAWLTANAGLIVAVACIGFAVALALLVVHFISEGALIGGIARVANDEPTTLGTAWGLGRQLAWSYVGLFLLAVGLALALALAVGIVVAVLFGVGQGNPGLAAALGVILGLIALAVGIPFAIAASIVVAYAQRAIAVDALGPLGAVERGIALLRARLGSSLALWLVSLVVTIGAGIAVVIGLIIVLIPLGIVGAAAYFTMGLSAPTFVLGALLGLVLLVALLVAAAAINTYTAAFWTLGYLGVTDRYPPPLPPAPPPEPLPPAPLPPAP